MKKISILAISAVVISLTSCKKDYTCTCTSTSTAPGSTTDTQEFTIVKAKKSDAKKVCVKTTQDYTSGGNTYTDTNDCKLK